MKNQRLLRIAIPAILAVALLAVPTLTHAVDFTWFGIKTFALDGILDLGLSLVTTFNALAGQLLNVAKDALQWTLKISLELILGLPVIDKAWNVMRDMANLVFVLMLILISFSTIFNVVKGLQRFHYRTALMPVIIAALMMNFSLAIGKAGVLAFDRVAHIFINIMPNLGDDLTRALKPQAVVLKPEKLVGPLPSNGQAIFDATKDRTEAEDKRYKECLNEERPVVTGDSGDAGADFLVWAYDNVFGDVPQRKSVGDCNLEIIAARQGALKVTAGQDVTPEEQASYERLQASASSNASQEKIYLIFSGIITGMLVVLLACCLLTPALFLLVRVLMLWVLLFSSPIAWASYAVPGSDFFKKWWDWFIGWNAFGPVYLFCLIPGMIVLSQSGEMLTGLGSAAGGTGTGLIGTAADLFQIFMFNAFAVMIFLGGLGVAQKSSFASSVKGTAVLGGLASKIGAFDSSGLGGARFAGKYTPGAATVRARAERAAQQTSERIGRSAVGRGLGRVYQAVKPASYEERLTAARAAAGVTGATSAYDKLRGGQVEEARKKLKSASDFRDIAGGKNAKDQRLDYLTQQMRSSDPSVALAAREELLKMNKLSREEIEETAKMYGRVSPTARKEFENRARRAPGQANQERRTEAKKASEETADTFAQGEYGSAADVASALNGLDPTKPDYAAAIEGIGRKAPLLLLEHLNTNPATAGTPVVNKVKAFGPALKNPDVLFDLPPQYFDKGTNTPEFQALRDAVEQQYGPASTSAAKNKRRDDRRDKLMDLEPARAAEIDALFL